MSNCTKCNKCKTTCGCTDDVLNMSLFCEFPECPNPEKCSETFSTDCIIYTGDEIQDAGIPKGVTLTTFLQKLVGIVTNPGCNLPGGTCLSVVGFNSITIAKTTAKFGWGAVVGSTNYILEYKEHGTPTWSSNPAVTTTYDTIGPLLPDTSYDVRVITNCSGNYCYSSTLLITTQPT